MHPKTIHALGVAFYNEDLESACLRATQGALVTAPSGPGLAHDLVTCSVYRRAIAKSDIVLADSGLLCLWQKWIKRKVLCRISGLIFLKRILDRTNWSEESVFWIMPDQIQAEVNAKWVEKIYHKKIEETDIYLAPQYIKKGEIIDQCLLSQIEANRPSSIFIQLGGGVQERLGLYLKDNLSYLPSIYCTGAALAFLSGQQARIPDWADSLYLGWLLRCINNPSVFIPRYIKAFRLILLLAKYGEKEPPLRS